MYSILNKFSKSKNEKEMSKTLEDQESIKESAHNILDSSYKNKDINTCFMIDVESQENKVTSSSSHIQTKYDEVLMLLKKCMKRQIDLLV